MSKPRLFRCHGIWYCGMRGYGRVGSGYWPRQAYADWLHLQCA